jgi:hypothetical protein
VPDSPILNTSIHHIPGVEKFSLRLEDSSVVTNISTAGVVKNISTAIPIVNHRH